MSRLGDEVPPVNIPDYMIISLLWIQTDDFVNRESNINYHILTFYHRRQKVHVTTYCNAPLSTIQTRLSISKSGLHSHLHVEPPFYFIYYILYNIFINYKFEGWYNTHGSCYFYDLYLFACTIWLHYIEENNFQI